MNLIERIRAAFKRCKLRQQAKDKLGEVILTPRGYLQKSRQIDCIIKGHIWSTDFNPKDELKKPLKDRVYCKHCGMYYHDFKFHEIDVNE